MKRRVYDLADEPFAMFVNRVDKILKAEGINYNLVGGVAAQLYILDMLSKKHDKKVMGLVTDTDIRLQDYLRGTDDVDIALNLQEKDIDKTKKIKKFLPNICEEDISPSGNHIVKFKMEREGISRPRYRVYVDDKGTSEDSIAMNISRGQKKDLHALDFHWYNEFSKQSKEIKVPFYDDYTLNSKVIKLEHLLASKIAQSRAKDLMDIKNISGLVKDLDIKLKFKEMDKILLPYHEDNYWKFLNTEYPNEVERLDSK